MPDLIERIWFNLNAAPNGVSFHARGTRLKSYLNIDNFDLNAISFEFIHFRSSGEFVRYGQIDRVAHKEQYERMERKLETCYHKCEKIENQK